MHNEKQYARGQQNLAQLPVWDAKAGSRGIQGQGGIFFLQGLKFSEKLAQRGDAAMQLSGGTGPIPEAASPRHCRKLVYTTPALGKGRACPSLSCAVHALIAAFFLALKWNWINSVEH